MADEVVGDQLGRYHVTNRGAALDEGAFLLETDEKQPFYAAKKDSKARRPSFVPQLKGVSRHAFDVWIENPENIDPELRLLIKDFFKEKFGVSFAGLLRILKADNAEYEEAVKRWEKIPKQMGMRDDEAGLFRSWLENRGQEREKCLLFQEIPSDLIEQSLFSLFHTWQTKESSSSQDLVDRTIQKTRQFFALEKERQKEGRKLVFLFNPDRLESSWQKDQIKKWLEAWDSGKVKEVILNFSPIKTQKIVRIGLRFDSEEGEKETFVDFRDFCQAFGLAEDPQKITPEIDIKGFRHWWQGHEFVFLLQNVPVEKGEVKNTKAEVLIANLPGKKKATS